MYDESALRKLLDEALESSSLPWWQWDIEKNTVTFNGLKVTMLGYRPEDFIDVGYQAFTDLLHPDDYERTMEAMRAYLEGRAQIYEVDYRIRRANGAYTWYMDRGCAIARCEDGSPKVLRGLVVDLGAAFSDSGKEEVLIGMFRRAVVPPDKETGTIITICATCKKLKLDGEWVSVEDAFLDFFPNALSHGICGSCVRRLYPEMAQYILDDPKPA